MSYNFDGLAKELARNPEAANELQVAIQKHRELKGSLNKAGEGVSEPKQTRASQVLNEMAKENGFEPDAVSMEYKGSEQNYIFVKSQIAHKFGDDIAEEYKPTIQVKPKTAWLQAGFLLKKGEEPLCHITTWRNNTPYNVALFHELQMIKA